MAFKPSLRRKVPDDTVEPNITPIMNLMVVLIPMLLSVAEFVHLSLLEYLPPPAEGMTEETADETGGDQGGAEIAELNLLLNATDDGFEISLFGETKGENFKKIPKLPSGEYDYESLHTELVRIKEEIIGPAIRTEDKTDDKGKTIRMEIFKYPDAQLVKISAKGDLPWETIVKIMDTCREYKEDDIPIKKPLFPSPMLGQIQ